MRKCMRRRLDPKKLAETVQSLAKGPGARVPNSKPLAHSREHCGPQQRGTARTLQPLYCATPPPSELIRQWRPLTASCVCFAVVHSQLVPL
ncbi:hypothetical protein NDU88_005367 [Pleurodeles waltl]|uniref:Uncharacterized protein n=1 Tax=Pleurodeles waltl TaxID=8319 RepID=A0AAV7PFJ3_PLEWA|nr:hypothetical protein NDU88_005367 [Pleurodeles waltl]